MHTGLFLTYPIPAFNFLLGIARHLLFFAQQLKAAFSLHFLEGSLQASIPVCLINSLYIPSWWHRGQRSWQETIIIRKCSSSLGYNEDIKEGGRICCRQGMVISEREVTWLIKCCTSCGSHHGQASCQASWNLPVTMKKRRKPVNSLLNNLINISSHKHILWFNFVLVIFFFP